MGKNKRCYLEYSKLILEKVSFDKRLFWKEYRKSFNHLTKSESAAFKYWIVQRYSLQGKTASRLKVLQPPRQLLLTA
jgi:hypothetical protein